MEVRMNLKATYRAFNRQYFEGKLPIVDVRFSSLVPYDEHARSHVHGVTCCWKKFCGNNCSKSFILVNPVLQYLEWEQSTEFVILHEMVHLKALLGDRRYATHGPVFQKEMQRLAMAGAFQDRW